jgi:hypothetical protein
MEEKKPKKLGRNEQTNKKQRDDDSPNNKKTIKHGGRREKCMGWKTMMK